MATRKPFRVSISPEIESIASLWPTMTGTESRHAYPFQGRDFLDVWLKTIGRARGIEPAFLTVEDGAGHPVMLVPLGIERRSCLRCLVFLDGGVVDYNAPLLFQAGLDAPEMAEIWQDVIAKTPPFDVTVLEKTPVAVDGLSNPIGLVDSIPDKRSGHLLTLSGTWEQYAATRLPRRQDSKRKRRQLGEHGPIRLAVAQTQQEAEAYLAVMIRQKTRRYLETFGWDDFERPGYRAYFPMMTERFCESGLVHVSAVFVGDTIVATHWGIVAGRRFHYLMPAFEAGDWRRFSPGRMLIEELIAWSYGHGLEIFDFGPGDEPFKDEFSDTVVPLLRVEKPASILGRLQLGAVRLRKAVGNSPIGPSLKGARDWIRQRRGNTGAPPAERGPG